MKMKPQHPDESAIDGDDGRCRQQKADDGLSALLGHRYTVSWTNRELASACPSNNSMLANARLWMTEIYSVQKPKTERSFAPSLLLHSFAPCFCRFPNVFNNRKIMAQKRRF
jgi:hypothetical protein